MPHRVPISPQWRMNFCWTGESLLIVSVISVITEITARRTKSQVRIGGTSAVRRGQPVAGWRSALEVAGERGAPGGAQGGDLAVDDPIAAGGDGEPVAAHRAEVPDGDRRGGRHLLQAGAGLGGGGDDDAGRRLAEQVLVETAGDFETQVGPDGAERRGDGAFQKGEGEAPLGPTGR